MIKLKPCAPVIFLALFVTTACNSDTETSAVETAVPETPDQVAASSFEQKSSAPVAVVTTADAVAQLSVPLTAAVAQSAPAVGAKTEAAANPGQAEPEPESEPDPESEPAMAMPAAFSVDGISSLSETGAALPEESAKPTTLVTTEVATEIAPATVTQARSGPTAKDAQRFVRDAEVQMLQLVIDAERAAWVQANFITFDTQIIAAAASEKATATGVRLATEAAQFNDLQLDYDTRRKLDLLKLGLLLPAPPDPAKSSEVATLSSRLDATYGKGEYCRANGDCLDLTAMTNLMAESRDPNLLQELWTGWRRVAPPMKADYQRLARLANEGASHLGYADLGALWRSGYDMPADDFAKETDRLWNQVQPLYKALHCHVRAELADWYGERIVAQDQPIPAHLLGNMWGQSWGNIYDLVAPKDANPGYDLTGIIRDSGLSERDMVKGAEKFFTSLGFAPLPATFWERSLFTKPADRDVTCHASAWDLDQEDDLRIKMCIQKNADDFVTVHHELGHNFYQRAYKQQPFFYRNSANDGFHEAIGDTVALSVTPSYLQQIGLLEDVPDASKDIGLLLNQALDKVAFLPFALLVDRWRWQVFKGQTTPDSYNADWWQLRTRYQGIAPPVARSEADFDPGAKYHIPASVPYSRYFLAGILQFQFHRSLCAIAGNDQPLHRCSIYGNAQAGSRLNQMLEMGASRPWPEALEALTGSRQMDATAIVDYFAPLKVWLDDQNAERSCGW